MKKVNVLLSPLVNEYGSNYGWEYLFFPDTNKTEIDKYLSSFLYSDHYRIFDRFEYWSVELAEEELEEIGSDIWNQRDILEFDSFKEAIEYYYL